MSTAAASYAPTTVVALLHNQTQLQVQVPHGANAVCEVKRVVQSTLNVSPLLQRVVITNGGVDSLSTPVRVSVSVRPPRTESATVDVQLMSEARTIGVTRWLVKVDPTDSVLDLKFALAALVGARPDDQRLFVRAPCTTQRAEMKDGCSLASCGVLPSSPSVAPLVIRLMFEYPSFTPGHGPAHATRAKLLERNREQDLTMGHIFLSSVVKAPNGRFLGTRAYLPAQAGKPAERGEYTWLTYGAAGKRVANMAAGLRTLGIKAKDSVGIVGQNRAEWTLADMTCNVTGFVSVPLYDTLGADAIQFVINHANVRAIIASPKELPALAAIRASCPTLETVIVMDDTTADAAALAKLPTGLFQHRLSEVEAIGAKNLATFPLEAQALPQDVHTICYTSGTTGNPKGAILLHANIVAGMAAIDERASSDDKANDVFFSYLPLAHIYERIAQATLIANGGAIGFSQGDPLKLMDDAQALQPTIFPSVPRVYQRVYDKVRAQVADSGLIKSTLFNKAMGAKLDKLHRGDILADGMIDTPMWDKIVFSKLAAMFGGKVKLMSSGAAPLSANVAEFVRAAFCTNLCEGYGLTETGAALTVSSRDDTIYGHVGTPVGCVQVKLVDVPDMEYLSSDLPNPRGEIWVRGPNIFQGYYKQPDVTAEVFEADVDGGLPWFKTGDIAMWLPDGSLKIVDRKKNIFKLSQGEYCRPEYVEGVYKSTPQLASIFVHGASDQSFLVAVIYPDPDALKSYCSANGVKGATVADQVKDPRVIAWLQGLIDATGKREKLRGFEMVKRIHVCSEDFSVENGLLTPTLKLKRNIAAKHFAAPIAQLYKEGEKAPAAKIKANL